MRLHCYYRGETCCVRVTFLHFFEGDVVSIKSSYTLLAHEGVCMGVGSNKIVSLLFYFGADVSGFNVQFFGL